MKINISDDTLNLLREEIYNMLDAHGNMSYDYQHVRRVERECKVLAEQSDLDKNIAVAIGLLHDIGRLSSTMSSEPHAVYGSKLAKSWLFDHQVDDKSTRIICHAIFSHSNKKTIHDPYDELIKDADSIAHLHEFPDSIGKYEKARAHFSKLSPLNFNLSSPENIISIYSQKIAQIYQYFSKKNFTEEDVHQMRLLIRSIQIFLKLIQEFDESKKYLELNNLLRNMFKSLEESRKLTVFKKELQSLGIEGNKLKPIKKDIKRHNNLALDKINLSKKEISTLFEEFKFETIDEQDLSRVFKQSLSLYKKQLALVDTTSIKDIHNLRIQGKMLKYLIDDGVVQIVSSSEEQEYSDYQLISGLHRCIGSLHDISEDEILYKNYYKHKKTSLKKSELKLVKRHFLKKNKAEQKELTFLLFQMRKRFQ